jgi:hypothetical protein
MSKNARKEIIKNKNKFDVLEVLIRNYADACVAESWKGGGDPNDTEVIEARLALARSELNAHINVMRREFE